jgi:tetratricopeptide (TPR) repeat protein
VEAGRVGRELLGRGAYEEAEQVLVHGLQRVKRLPGAGTLTNELTRAIQQSQRGRRATELHVLVDRLRFSYDADLLAKSDLKTVADACEALWQARSTFAPVPGVDLAPGLERQLRTDLVDLAFLSADFHVREKGGNPEATVVGRLDLIESLLGPDPALERVRVAYRHRSGAARVAVTDPTLRAWELYLLGRARLNAGDLEGAANLLRQAVDGEPQGFWPHFHFALCAYRRGRYEDAVAGFSACLSLTQNRRGLCHYHRGLAYVALSQGDATRESALRDFNRALELEPTLAEAALNRALLHHAVKRYPQAVADLELALHNGYAPGVVHRYLAEVALSAGDLPTARVHAWRALDLNPTDKKAQALLDRLRTDR